MKSIWSWLRRNAWKRKVIQVFSNSFLEATEPCIWTKRQLLKWRKLKRRPSNQNRRSSNGLNMGIWSQNLLLITRKTSSITSRRCSTLLISSILKPETKDFEKWSILDSYWSKRKIKMIISGQVRQVCLNFAILGQYLLRLIELHDLLDIYHESTVSVIEHLELTNLFIEFFRYPL